MKKSRLLETACAMPFLKGMGIATLFAFSCTAHAAFMYETTVTFNSAIGTPSVDTLVHTWSTNVASGAIDETDLIDWSYELLNGGSLEYSEDVIIGGAVQSIAGVARTLADLNWNFNIDALTLGLFDNDISILQATGSGVTYNVFSEGSSPVRVVVDRFENQILTSSATVEFTQSTSLVPIPAAVWLFGSGLLGLVGMARRKAA